MEKNKNDLKTYLELSDLHLVAAISSFFQIEAIDRTNPHRVIFKFAESDELYSLIDQYWSGTLKLNVLRYSQNLKSLKNRILQ
ncbi:MAG: DUF5659 domain-containing protein [Actinobacteria bacterium]|nr:DUF5659 domain-containing protein [Actinomycetota bacterium]MCL5072922.1 DUF5659 domain-containing protein [Actinomycetota bacterium]